MVDTSDAGPRWLFPECDSVCEDAAAIVEVKWGWSDAENVAAWAADAEVVGEVTTWQPC